MEICSDNCPCVSNQLQTDGDGDGVGDECDACLGFDDNVNTDGDSVSDDCDLCPSTIPNATVDADSCPPAIPGDCDGDGDIDQNDITLFEACASGPAVPLTPGC